jgi:hypothetical protein
VVVTSDTGTPVKQIKLTISDGYDSNPEDSRPFRSQNVWDLLKSPVSENGNFKTYDDELSPLKSEESPKIKLRAYEDLFNVDSESQKLDYGLKEDRPGVMHETDSQSQSSGFRLPSVVEDMLREGQMQENDDTVSPASFSLDASLQDMSPVSPEDLSEAVCPVCGDPVEEEFLQDYHIGRMNIRMQANFCRAHKKRSAQQVWSTRGYPKIKWQEMDSRIEKHHQYLRELLDGASSYYRNILKEAVKSGKNRNLKQTMLTSGDDALTPGYYGSRGQRAMSDNIMKKFSPTLRTIAVKDRLVAAHGVTGYVQAVLVPELAVMMIKEDMDVEVEEARIIMRDSIMLGDLVNEEAEDVLPKHLDHNES